MSEVLLLDAFKIVLLIDQDLNTNVSIIYVLGSHSLDKQDFEAVNNISKIVTFYMSFLLKM